MKTKLLLFFVFNFFFLTNLNAQDWETIGSDEAKQLETGGELPDGVYIIQIIANEYYDTKTVIFSKD